MSMTCRILAVLFFILATFSLVPSARGDLQTARMATLVETDSQTALPGDQLAFTLACSTPTACAAPVDNTCGGNNTCGTALQCTCVINARGTTCLCL